MVVARLAHAADLSLLLALFAVSEVSPSALPARAESIWTETLGHQGVFVFVSDEGARIAATCMLITAPNVLREGRRHGFLENVVTHPELRGRGHGRAVVAAALEHAWSLECHHVLMQSGRTDARVHRFYENLGFIPGRRTAYVALRPEGYEGGRGSERSRSPAFPTKLLEEAVCACFPAATAFLRGAAAAVPWYNRAP